MNNVKGRFISVNGIEYYKIENYNEMKPFLFTLATDSDVWIHMSSSGGVTAGRKNKDMSIFPYVNEDVLHHSGDTGSKTVVRISRNETEHLWQPFDNSYIKQYKVSRNIYKSTDGSSVIFEEINRELDLIFRYSWQTCEKYGIVRTADIENTGAGANIELIDGVINILPYGVSSSQQISASCLVDGYKHTMLIDNGRCAVYSLSSAILDQPEPEDISRCTVFWNRADFDTKIYLRENALSDFASLCEEAQSDELIGERGCYLMRFGFELGAGDKKSWQIIGDIGRSQTEVAELTASMPEISIDKEIGKTRRKLMELVSKTDGMQCTGNKIACAHHMSDVTYNDMRGGMFLNDYDFDAEDFLDFVKIRNPKIYESLNPDEMKSIVDTDELKAFVIRAGDKDLIRFAYEYVPISFSRRHGDPSRPWNNFSISLKKADGTPVTGYEGNWRDIFQNWEAMCMSFPMYYENIIVKFLNACTVDGYNPFKLSRTGPDWDKPDPKEPWSTTGYWSDHQIIYLVRLIEGLNKYSPKRFDRLVREVGYSYSDVPYEIVCFDDMVKNPKQTVKYNYDKNSRIDIEAEKYGTDRKLVNCDGEVYYTSFAEKYLLLAMTKMTNHAVGGGIWMNTQRPEWNDANNAIVGYGLSVVTACQLKRYLSMGCEIFSHYRKEKFEMSVEAAEWLDKLIKLLDSYQKNIDEDMVDDVLRFKMLKEQAQLFDAYKAKVYKSGFSSKVRYSYDSALEFCKIALCYINYTIARNKRRDGLFNAYNLLGFGDNSMSVSELMPMLEGQAAVLGCGFLSGSEAVQLLENMFESGLYSERDKSFYLYPINMTKSFMKKNIIPEQYVNKSELIKKLIENGNRFLVEKDLSGNIRFNPDICKIDELVGKLSFLEESEEYGDLTKSEHNLVCEAFESVFEHSRFIGRSQAMYKYEGIGCIYWHQNSKLCVSVQETLLNAYKNGESQDVIDKLTGLYKRVVSGMGFKKTPEECGAFPADAYSHTQFSGGAAQPVMTGQVKEDILLRLGELGVIINNGCIEFHSELINSEEYLSDKSEFSFIDLNGEKTEIELDKDSFGFTVCQVPIICTKGMQDSTDVYFTDGSITRFNTNIIPADISCEIFNRTGRVRLILLN